LIIRLTLMHHLETKLSQPLTDALSSKRHGHMDRIRQTMSNLSGLNRDKKVSYKNLSKR
jgi:hypothetical protein